MDKLLETLQGYQGQVISDEMLAQLRGVLQTQRTPQTPSHSERSQPTYCNEDLDIVIDGETEMDDLLVAQRVAMLETAAMEKYAPSVKYVAARGLDGLADVELSDSSDDEDIIELVKEVSTPEVTEARSALDAILAQNGLIADEEESEKEEEDLAVADFDFSTLPASFSNEEPLIPVGTIESMVESRLMVVKGYQVALDEKSAVCLGDDRSLVFGVILETFGAVQHPYYLIAISNMDVIKQYDENTLIGMRVSTVPSHSRLILLDEDNGVYSIIGQEKDDMLEDGDDDSDTEQKTQNTSHSLKHTHPYRQHVQTQHHQHQQQPAQYPNQPTRQFTPPPPPPPKQFQGFKWK